MSAKLERTSKPGIFRRGRTYCYSLRDGSGRQRWVSGFPSMTAAANARDKARLQVREGNYVAPTRQTLETFAGEWLESRTPKLKPSTLSSYADLLRDHVNPRIGNVPLQKITAAHLDALYAELLTKGRRDGTGGLSPRTVRYVHTVIRAALQTAFRWGRITHNPADRSDPPESVRTEARHWTTDNLRRFLAHVEGDRLAPLYHLAAMTGLRRGEVLGLRWSDLDLEAQTLKVNQSLVVVDGHSMFTTPKTDAGRRTVSLDPRTVAVLRAHRKAQMAERLAAGPAWADSGLVFTREDGRPLAPDWVYKRFVALVLAAGVPLISFHGLRHSHATALLGAGVDLKLTSARLGHSSVRITADTYQHVEQAMDQLAATQAAALIYG
jgi:integrase